MEKLTFKEINKDSSKGEYALACRYLMKETLMSADSIEAFVRGFEERVKYYPQRNHRRLNDSYIVEMAPNNRSAMIIKTSNTKKAVDLYYIHQVNESVNN